MTQLPTAYTPAEAAAWLRERGVDVNEQTVRRWAKGGHVRAMRLPYGRVRIPQSELEALVEPTTAGAA
ncbi:MAG TPA: helix-turn-helix domain-containing protein [Gemmatimonadaceae bacterium]|nr:helix-turn-helix domain-containing protein [Gemmatimonadaceae bacterium]